MTTRPRSPTQKAATGQHRSSVADWDNDSAQVYRLHVELQKIAPAIWRELLVPRWITLAKLHHVLQAAMGWTNSHLHQFEIAGTDYGIPDDEWPELAVTDERRVQLGDCLGVSVRDFRYRYDFGDGWDHAITVESVEPIIDYYHYPLCTAGANACPPEDVGGSHGYTEFVQTIGNRRHPEYEDMLRWCGGIFDPKGFDLNAANAALRRIRIPSRR